MSNAYFEVKRKLSRYNHRWWKVMTVTDIATWLCSWHDSSEILGLYVDAYAERKASLSVEDRVYAAKISQAAYVALDPEVIRRMAVDEVFKELVEVSVSERRKFKLEQREEVKRLADLLKTLLPRYPYNKLGGAE